MMPYKILDLTTGEYFKTKIDPLISSIPIFIDEVYGNKEQAEYIIELSMKGNQLLKQLKGVFTSSIMLNIKEYDIREYYHIVETNEIPNCIYANSNLFDGNLYIREDGISENNMNVIKMRNIPSQNLVEVTTQFNDQICNNIFNTYYINPTNKG